MVKPKACPCLTDQLGVNRVGLLPSRWTSGVARSTDIVRPGEPVRFVPRAKVSGSFRRTEDGVISIGELPTGPAEVPTVSVAAHIHRQASSTVLPG
jgi:hypothetical protein